MERLQCEVCRLNYVSCMETAYDKLGLEQSKSSVVQAQKVVQGDEDGLGVCHRLILEECSLYVGVVFSSRI